MSEPIQTGDGGAGWYGLLGLLQPAGRSGGSSASGTRRPSEVRGTVRAGGQDGVLFGRFDGWRWDGSVEDAQPR